MRAKKGSERRVWGKVSGGSPDPQTDTPTTPDQVLVGKKNASARSSSSKVRPSQLPRGTLDIGGQTFTAMVLRAIRQFWKGVELPGQTAAANGRAASCGESVPFGGRFLIEPRGVTLRSGQSRPCPGESSRQRKGEALKPASSNKLPWAEGRGWRAFRLRVSGGQRFLAE